MRSYSIPVLALSQYHKQLTRTSRHARIHIRKKCCSHTFDVFILFELRGGGYYSTGYYSIYPTISEMTSPKLTVLAYDQTVLERKVLIQVTVYIFKWYQVPGSYVCRWVNVDQA